MVTLRLHTVGEVAIVGPAINALDADVGAAPDPSATHKNAAEAKRAAQLRASAQEVRSMLGAMPPCASFSMALTWSHVGASSLYMLTKQLLATCMLN